MAKEKICGIYKITSYSGKVYVGQALDIFERWGDYKRLACKAQRGIYNSLLKYGIDYHGFEIVEECNIDQLNTRERYWQEQFDVIGKNGLNCMLIGYDEVRKVMSEETRQIMSKQRKGRMAGEKHPLYGIGHTEEAKKKISESRKGKYTGEDNAASKIILNTETGIYYYGCTEAAASIGANPGTLKNWLRGHRPNKTSLIYT